MTANGIIFDLDGTLWDASREVTTAWNAALARKPDTKNCQLTVEQMQGLMGKTMTEIFDFMLPSAGKERRAEIAQECCREENRYLQSHGARLFPQVAETLETLSRSYRLFIVSNCQNGYIEAFLGYYGFGAFFTDTECFGRTGKNKGDNIRILLERNPLEKAVYVGDTQIDLESAEYAGLPFLHAAYGYGRIEKAVRSIRTFSELTSAVPEMI